jgi:KipI family sensor histidine kinase inhibitor
MMERVKLLRVGRDAVLVEVADSGQAVSLATWGRERRLAREVVPGARTVLFDGLLTRVLDPAVDLDRFQGLLADWRPAVAAPGPLVELPVSYDGPDLEEVATRWGCGVEDVGARHQAVELVAAFCGFAPGFAYLAGLDVDVPRLATPRTRVPAGSVALAGRWCGVYPTASPGGWRIIGHTDAVLWDARRDPPALIAPGTRVRFRAASESR